MQHESRSPNATGLDVAPTYAGEAESPDTGGTGGAHPLPRTSAWIDSARFVIAWSCPAFLSLYLKWYLMVNEGGFAREARSIGVRSLSFTDRLVFFRSDVVLGLFLIPALLLIASRYLPRAARTVLNAAFSACAVMLLSVQLFSLKEFGKFCTLAMARVGLGWGLHEPGSYLKYVASWETLLLAVFLMGAGVASAWAYSRSGRYTPKRVRDGWKTATEICLFALSLPILFSVKADVPKSPYQQSTLVRSIASLWKENSVDSGEFAGYDFERGDRTATEDLSRLSAGDLLSRYRALAHAPVPDQDLRYFGKQRGANVLFFVLETTPETYLPIDGDMQQFPNIGRLRGNSFIGARHYTTFPLTRCALFSAFTSWYPPDDAKAVFGSAETESSGSFISRLAAEGYETAVFSPLRGSDMPDESLFKGLGFQHQYVPDSAISDYDRSSSWKQARIAADVATLRLLEKQMGLWTEQDHRFVAAFLPQIGHFPYPDNDPGNRADDLRRRGRAILATEDQWLGEVISILQKHGQIDNTIIVIFGDHGPRTIEENPELRRGTIDEVAFHVPLLIYAPRALDHSEKIEWLTSHIDVGPTVLDLLGEKGGRESEQGSPLWMPGIADRTTFFFARPMFGADGYTTGGRSLMWHYFSDSVYENSAMQFDANNVIPRSFETSSRVKSNILNIVALGRAWRSKFGRKSDSSRSAETSATAP